MIRDILVTPLKRIPVDKGDVLHALKSQEESFKGFGEAYFSLLHPGAIKGWKKYHQMTSNLIVPKGKVRFVLRDDRESSADFQEMMEVIIGDDHYARLTIPPGIWTAFQGLDQSENMILNIASIPHDPKESESWPLERIPYAW